MSLFDHTRFKIVSEAQHLYSHGLDEMEYAHPSLPGIYSNAEEALDYVFNILHPRNQPSVLDVSQLPNIGNTVNDQRVVQEGRTEILPLSVNSVLAAGVLEVGDISSMTVGKFIRLGHVDKEPLPINSGINKTAGFPDGGLYVASINVPLSTVNLVEDVALLIPADISGIGLIGGLIDAPDTDSINGDNAEIWQWTQYDGQLSDQWNKIADMDWGINGVIQALQSQTQFLYVRKYGITDYDPLTELPLVGDFGGQHLYGGELANQHLTLHANNGDPLGNTGFIQFEDDSRPFLDLTFDLGVLNYRFNELATGLGRFNAEAGPEVAGDGLTITSTAAGFGQISDSSDIITFGDDALRTSGVVDVGELWALRSIGMDTTNSYTAGVEDTFAMTMDTVNSEVDVTSTYPLINYNGLDADSDGGILRYSELHAEDRIFLREDLFAAIPAGFWMDITVNSATALSETIEFDTNATCFDFLTHDICTTGHIMAGSLEACDVTLGVDACNAISTLDKGLPASQVDLVIKTFAANNAVGGNILMDRDTQFSVGVDVNLLGGVLTVVGSAVIDTITIDDNNITSVGAIIDTNSSLVPIANNVIDLGDATNAWRHLYLDTDIISKTAINKNPGPGINVVTGTYRMVDLMTLRSSAYRDLAKTTPAQAGDALFWDDVNQVWLASIPDTEVDHDELDHLDTAGGAPTPDAGHTQFLLLSGRAGGQSAFGGLLATRSMTLLDNAVDGEGIVIGAEAVSPNITGIIDLGTAALRYDDLYMDGELFGARIENFADLTAINTAFNMNHEGRMAWNQADEDMYVNDGEKFVKIGRKSYTAIHLSTDFGTVAVPTDINVSHGLPANQAAGIGVADSRQCIWQLCCVANNEEVMGVSIQKTSSTTVRIVQEILLPVGNYRLIGIEV